MKMPINWDLSANKKTLRSHSSLRRPHRVAVALSAAVWLGLAQSGSAQSPTPTPSPCPHCTTETFPANTPLNDLGQGTYYPSPSVSPSTTPVQGGLYPNGYNQRPVDHNNDGITIATTQIYPRNFDTGQRDMQNGKIVMISIGMCNTTIEFGTGYHGESQYTFQTRAMADNAKRGKLVVVDCAKAGQDAPKWANGGPPDQDPQNPWAYLDNQLTKAGVSRKQVQVVWLKEAAIEPARDGVWPEHAKVLKDNLETILDHLVSLVPDYGFGNVQMVFLSPRTRAWTLDDPGFHHSPEPYAYETGFADKWVIEDQLNPPGGVDQGWPWLSWGPYLWTDGTNPRSDGLVWLCSDVQDDCVHPVTSAVLKVANQLLAFFKTDPVSTPWFLKTPDNPPTITVDPPSATITAGQSVNFHASATAHAHNAMIKELLWTFDDGDYAYDPYNYPLMTDVTKTFKAPSESGNPYQVHVTAIDNKGNTGFATVPITVNPPPPRPGSVEDKKHRAGPLPRPEQGAGRKIGT